MIRLIEFISVDMLCSPSRPADEANDGEAIDKGPHDNAHMPLQALQSY